MSGRAIEVLQTRILAHLTVLFAASGFRLQAESATIARVSIPSGSGLSRRPGQLHGECRSRTERKDATR